MTPEFTEEMKSRLSSPDELIAPETDSSLAIGGLVYVRSSHGWYSRTVARNVRPSELHTILASFARQGNITDLHWWVEGF